MIISFQQTHGDSATEYKVASAGPTVNTEEIALPIVLGPIKSIPKKSTILYKLSKSVTLKEKDYIVEVDLDSKKANDVSLIVPSDVVYPSIMYLNDEKTDLPVVQVKLPLRKPNEEFELSLGVSHLVVVKDAYLLKDEGEYKLIVQSLASHDLKLRVSGWRLLGRRDMFTLRAGETASFSGKIPKEKIVVENT
jgi:hypothetical protein